MKGCEFVDIVVDTAVFQRRLWFSYFFFVPGVQSQFVAHSLLDGCVHADCNLRGRGRAQHRLDSLSSQF